MNDNYDLIKLQQVEIESLRKRLRHLLQSNFIASFDEWDQRKGDYRRDIKEADEIIKRQQAEIRRLESNFAEEWEGFLKINGMSDRVTKTINEFKAEAIKEFAERLEEKKFALDNQNEEIFYAVDIEDVDNLKKEMIEKGGANNDD